jgi:hypothetical protein
MKTFEPKCEVRLIKARARSEVVTGKQAAASRYGGNITGINLTPFLSETGAVTVTKSVREPVGAFSFTLVDRTIESIGESMYALIEPMDIIEIRMARNVADYQKSSASAAQYRLPIVMRGFVTRVTRSMSIESGVPERAVTIVGHDYGKLLQIIRIFYNTFNAGYVADDIISGLKFFHQYADNGAARIKPAREFLNDIVTGIIDPYLKSLTPLQTPRELDVTVVKEFAPVCSVEALVSPLSVGGYSEGAIYDFMRSMLDVGPFNELYTEDTEDGVNLILRPAPFKDYATGQFLDPNAWADSLVLAMDVVQTMSLSRSDENVANFYWVTNSRWQLIDNSTQRMAANQGDPASFYTKDYVNTQLAVFGIRKMEAETSMAPIDALSPDSPTPEQAASESSSYLKWLADRRAFLAGANKDNVVLESGSMKIRGDERVKPGMYLTVQSFTKQDDAAPTGEYYAPAVTHEFIPYVGFFTTVQVERGTNFANRAQSQGTPYYDEMDLRGIN